MTQRTNKSMNMKKVPFMGEGEYTISIHDRFALSLPYVNSEVIYNSSGKFHRIKGASWRATDFTSNGVEFASDVTVSRVGDEWHIEINFEDKSTGRVYNSCDNLKEIGTYELIELIQKWWEDEKLYELTKSNMRKSKSKWNVTMPSADPKPKVQDKLQLNILNGGIDKMAKSIQKSKASKTNLKKMGVVNVPVKYADTLIEFIGSTRVIFTAHVDEDYATVNDNEYLKRMVFYEGTYEEGQDIYDISIEMDVTRGSMSNPTGVHYFYVIKNGNEEKSADAFGECSFLYAVGIIEGWISELGGLKKSKVKKSRGIKKSDSRYVVWIGEGMDERPYDHARTTEGIVYFNDLEETKRIAQIMSNQSGKPHRIQDTHSGATASDFKDGSAFFKSKVKKSVGKKIAKNMEYGNWYYCAVDSDDFFARPIGTPIEAPGLHEAIRGAMDMARQNPGRTGGGAVMRVESPNGGADIWKLILFDEEDGRFKDHMEYTIEDKHGKRPAGEKTRMQESIDYHLSGENYARTYVEKSKVRKSKNIKKSDDRAKILMDFLGISESEITARYDGPFGYGVTFETSEGEYAVMDDWESFEAVKEDLETLYDDAGWVLNLDIADYISESFWDELMGEETQFRVDNMDDDELLEESLDAGIIDDSYFDENEEFLGKIEEIREKLLVDIRIGHNSSYDYAINEFSEGELKEIIDDNIRRGNTNIDFNKLARDVIRLDGYGHILSGYDGSEEYVNGFYIFRTN